MVTQKLLSKVQKPKCKDRYFSKQRTTLLLHAQKDYSLFFTLFLFFDNGESKLCSPIPKGTYTCPKTLMQETSSWFFSIKLTAKFEFEILSVCHPGCLLGVVFTPIFPNYSKEKPLWHCPTYPFHVFKPLKFDHGDIENPSKIQYMQLGIYIL